MPPILNEDKVISREEITFTFQKLGLKALLSFILFIGLVSVAIYSYVFILLNKPPTDFPVNIPVSIPEGTSAREATAIFARAGLVQSEFALYLSLMRWHEPSDIKASTYIFREPIDTKTIAYELTQGNFATDLLRITHKEGERATTIAATAEKILSQFDAQKFIALAEPYEGRLFPDTYYVPYDFTAEELFELLIDTYTKRVHKPYYEDELVHRELTEDEMLILASIIEREANSEESMKMVSGILHNRLRIGMALQTDASIEYVLDKPLGKLVPEDLEIDSPYNTYLYPGLPPTPIGNPGLDAIKAVLEPTPSNYFFYITGNDGNFYYAENFDQHRLNIARYLR